MPIYTFERIDTGEEITVEMTMAEHEEFLKDSAGIYRQIITNVAISYGYGGIKTDNGWKSMLNRIKNNNHGSSIDSGNLGEI